MADPDNPRQRLQAPFYLELIIGLRRGELLALLWMDLNVENRTVSITKQVTRTKGELVVSQSKIHNSIRVLPVSQQAVELMAEEHKKHPGNPYMLPSPKTGRMFGPDSFQHTHEKILKASARAYSLPRSPAYLCNAVFEERRGGENAVQNPGILQRGLHSQHLHSCCTGYDAGGSGHHGGCDWEGDATTKLNVRQRRVGNSCPVLPHSIGYYRRIDQYISQV